MLSRPGVGTKRRQYQIRSGRTDGPRNNKKKTESLQQTPEDPRAVNRGCRHGGSRQAVTDNHRQTMMGVFCGAGHGEAVADVRAVGGFGAGVGLARRAAASSAQPDVHDKLAKRCIEPNRR